MSFPPPEARLRLRGKNSEQRRRGDKEKSVLASGHYKAPVTGSNTAGLVCELGSKPVQGGQPGLELNYKGRHSHVPVTLESFFPPQLRR